MENETGGEVAEATDQVDEVVQTGEQSDKPAVDPVEAAKSGSLKEAVKEQVRKYKLKISGRERDVDEKTLIALAQKGEAADQKFQKSAAATKKLEQLLAIAKKDPDAFIKQVLGQDAVQFSQKRLAKELEQLSLDPKEKELRDYKRKVEAFEAKQKQAAEQKQKDADQKAVEHWTKHYDTVLPKAITDAGLPLTEDVIRHATDIMIANLEQGFDLPMEAVMQLTKDRYLGSVKKFLTAANKDKLIQLLGEDVVAKLGVPTKKPVARRQAVQVGARDIEQPQKSEQERMRELDERLKKWAAQ